MDAFISYASANATRVARIERALIAAGRTVWRDRSKIRLGVLLRQQLQEAIAGSRALVLLWSRQAARSRWVAAEILTAFHVGRFIVPCALDDAPLPQFLSATVHLNLSRATAAATDALDRALMEAPASSNAIPPAESSRSAEQQRAIDAINRLQHDELDLMQRRALPAARRAHAKTDREVRRARRLARFDPLVLNLAGYHCKNAYLVKHWDAVQAGRGPKDSLLSRAERLFFETLFLDPTDPYGLDGLGSILRLEREFDAAEFFFTKAIEQAARRGVDYVEARQNVESVRRARGEPAREVHPAITRTAPEREARPRPPAGPPDTIADDLRSGERALRSGRWDAALAVFDRVLQISPSSGMAHGFRAEALLQLGRFDESLEAYDHTLALQPGNLAARSARAAILVGMGRIDEGLEDIDRVLAARPHDPEALYNKACALSLKQDGRAALDALQQAIRAYRPHRATAASDPHFAYVRDHPTYGPTFRALVKS
ncbi:MAG: TIR domain-containing protein [Longimicrobiales bacterium]